MGGAEAGTSERRRVQILVTGWSEDLKSLGVENRQLVCIGLGDDVLNAVDLAGGVGRWNGEPRHVGRQGYARVVLLSTTGDHADGAFEVGGKLVEVGLTGVGGVERDGDSDAILHDG